MDKTIVGPGAGSEKKLFQESEDVSEQAHSETVCVEFPSYKRVFVSGHVAADSEGGVTDPGDIEGQTRETLTQIQDKLVQFDGKMTDIVRVRVYVTDLNEDDFKLVHKARSEFFERDHHPASTLVEVGKLAREEALIEIDADAIIPDDGWDADVIES